MLALLLMQRRVVGLYLKVLGSLALVFSVLPKVRSPKADIKVTPGVPARLLASIIDKIIFYVFWIWAQSHTW